MIKHKKNQVNLKSTAYNQNGQRYWQQLAAYRSMCKHLRLTLLAKCIVDARNQNYTQKKKVIDKQPGDCKTEFSRTNAIEDVVIDRLACEMTCLYHPVHFSNTHLDTKCSGRHDSARGGCDHLYNFGAVCSSLSELESNEAEPCVSDNEHRRARSCATTKEKHIERTTRIGVSKIHHGHDNCRCAKTCTNVIHDDEIRGRIEATKYTKFVYKITKEIIHNGIYTDRELEKVFRKHVEENEVTLDMYRMMDEIYKLKLALNISDNPVTEKSEDTIDIRKCGPSTPPTFLSEKLYCSEKSERSESDFSSISNKSVVLIDVNSELLITEGNVLASLVEADIEPEQVRRIFQRISDRRNDDAKGKFSPTKEGQVSSQYDSIP